MRSFLKQSVSEGMRPDLIDLSKIKRLTTNQDPNLMRKNTSLVVRIKFRSDLFNIYFIKHSCPLFFN